MKEIPTWIYEKWQGITDLLSKLIGIPAALIMHTYDEYMEVLVSSSTEGNLYKVGDKKKWHGLYCETVIKTQRELLVSNALIDPNWDKNPYIKLGMISYLGYPLNYPDKTPFGTICILDYKENCYSAEFKQTLYYLKEVVENDLIAMFEFNNKEEKLNAQLLQQNKLLQMLKESAEENEQRLKEAQHLAHIGNWELDIINNNLYWSDEIYRIFNCKPQEFGATYEAFLSFIHPEDRNFVNESYINHLSTKKPYNITHRLLLANDEIKYVNERCTSEFDKHGNPIISKGTVADVTEQYKYEQKLLKAKEEAEQSNMLKTEFLHNLSHEIRTPMNGIIGFANFIDSPDLSAEKRSYYANIIQSCSLQLLKIIDDIIEISILETKRISITKDSFNLNELLMELYSVFNLKVVDRNIQIHLKKGLPDGCSKIISDRNKLHKILSNLIENAIKYTYEGFIDIGYQIDGDILKIYIKDSGIGISSENQASIFERFSQEEKEISRKQGGLGLGLSISKENALLLGGDIQLESEKGKGSTFSLVLPYQPAEPIKEFIRRNTHTDTPDLTENVVKILIAEDEEVNYLYLETVLEEMHDIRFKILHARNGKEAVDMFIKDNSIDLVLMDIKMPEMNGYEATKKIKSFRPEVPVIAQTAYSTESDRQKAFNHGCNNWIAKPIGKDALHKILCKYI